MQWDFAIGNILYHVERFDPSLEEDGLIIYKVEAFENKVSKRKFEIVKTSDGIWHPSHNHRHLSDPTIVEVMEVIGQKDPPAYFD